MKSHQDMGDAPLFGDEFPDADEGRHIGPFRWRGHLNWKDIVERIVSGFITGVAAACAFYLLERFLG